MSDNPKPSRPDYQSNGPLQEAAASGHSLLHRLDPRAKLICAFAGTLVLATSPAPLAPALGLAGGVFLAAWARLGWGRVFSRAAGINVFVVFLWIFLPWKIVYNGGLNLVYNPGGLAMAGLITLKVNAVFLLLLSLLGTSRVNDLLHALAHFHLPEKLVTLFLLFHRYLHLMFREYQRLAGAMKVRGFKPGTNMHTYRAYAYLVGMLLVKSYDRAERVYAAMLCRGFAGTFWLLDHFAWQKRDTAFCTGLGACILVLGLLQWSCSLWS